MRKFLLSCTMLASFGANVAAEPFVSGSEPHWGDHMSAKQRRQTGFDDVRTALKYNREPAVATRGVPGYAFKLLTMKRQQFYPGGQHGNGGLAFATVKSESFGVYASIQECDAARAIKVAELDASNARQPSRNVTVLPMTSTYDTTTTSTNSQTAPSTSTTTVQGPSGYVQYGPIEKMDVTFCEPGVYAPGQVSPNIAKNPDFPLTPAALQVAQDVTLEVPPGFVKQWIAPRPFSRVVPGTSEVVEVLSAVGRELVFMVKPDIALPPTTNILLVNDVGEVIANLHIVIPGILNHELHQGPDGTQLYRKDNPNYVAPKVKK
jgi:hypothetical protein